MIGLGLKVLKISVTVFHCTDRVRKKRSPWITSELLCKIRKRDFLKKKAISSNNSATRDQFKHARNQANNAVKLAKKRYVSDNLNASKGNSRNTWKVINELTSRNSGKSANILESRQTIE